MSFFKSKVFKGIMATTLAITLVTGSVLAVGYSQGWFNSEESISSYGGLLVSEGENNGVSLTATKVTVPEGAEYESAYSITAEVTPSTATDTTIDLSLAFSGTEVSWGTASTGTVTDYVKLSTDSITSGGSVTLYCYQAFGEQIILTGTAEGAETGTTVSGTCTMDYAAKYTDLAFSDNDYLYLNYDEVMEAHVDDVGSSDSNRTATYGDDFQLNAVLYVGFGSTYTVIDGIDATSVKIGVSTTLSTSYSTYSSIDNILAASAGADEYDAGDSYATLTYLFYEDNIVLNPTDIVAAFLGGYLTGGGITTLDSISSDVMREMYETLLEAYNAGEAAFTYTFTFTSLQTGTEYEFSLDCMYNPAGMYSYATAVQFSDNTLLF